MNLTFLKLEVRRLLRDRASLFFTAGLPVFFYIIFGAVQSWTDQPIGNGNVAMYIMIAMAAYGAVSATVNTGGRAALERMQGWGRQLGLTPLSDGTYVTTKAVLAVLVGAIPVALVYLIGALTGAEGSVGAWVLSAVILLAGASVFALYGLSVGLALKSEAALSAAGGSIVILGFLGNVFFPLSGVLLSIAKFTPMYGYVALARYPLTEGYVQQGTSDELVKEPLWIPLLNMGAWFAVLALVTVLVVRRSRARQ